MAITAVLPELILLCCACMMMLIDACCSLHRVRLTYSCAQIALCLAGYVSLHQYFTYAESFTVFANHYIVDQLAILSKLSIYLCSVLALAYAQPYLQTRRIPHSAYYLLSIFAVLGMSIMVSANNVVVIYLGLELSSLALYAAIALSKTQTQALEAALKYFVLGALASGIFLYGLSLLYGATGQFDLNSIALTLGQWQNHVSILLALLFIIAAMAFKLGAVPLHVWVPDVYQGAPSSLTLFIASAPKIAAFTVMFRLLAHTFATLQTNWIPILIILSILSMLLGNLLAIAQTNFKRMLAYSSIAHIGYTLLGFLSGTSSGYAAALFYLITYVLVAAGAFAIITLLSQHGVELEQLADYRGLNATHPWLAFMMLLLVFSMAGIPPTVGFFAKLGLLETLVQAHFTWLAVLALLFALIGAYYYLRIVMLMYFEEPLADDHFVHSSVTMSSPLTLLLSLNGGAALILGLLPSWLMHLCQMAIHSTYR